MLIKVGFEIELGVSAPTALIYLLRVHPSRRDDLLGAEELCIGPGLHAEDYLDSFGNLCGRVGVPSGIASVRLTGRAVVRDSGRPDPVDIAAGQRDPAELPTTVLQFLLPSRYCEVDSELLAFAWERFGATAPGWPRVQAICDFVHRHLRFDYRAARPTRTAWQAFHDGAGVCRDFAHLAVTLCRCMNIPARYATGYLGDIGWTQTVAMPMDFSAWFEAFLGDRWYSFDPRHNRPRIGRVLIAHGRDAADVPITMTFGRETLLQFDVVTEEIAGPV